jgi:predicted nucleic acid-binding protein
VIRAVIDTNVLVSGLLSPAGNEALIVLALHRGSCDLAYPPK